MTTSAAAHSGELLLGRYEVIKQIGAGGYGAIFQARQTTTGQLVAIKILLSDRLEDEETRMEEEGRFTREMQMIGQLSHPHIVRLIDNGVADGRRMMVLEYVDGHTLASEVANTGSMEPAIVKRIFIQVLDALSEAHALGIIHRDLKPQNIMLSGPHTRPNCKVLDFGIAGISEEKRDDHYKTLTQRGTIPGTPSYMSPEQIRFGKSGPPSDVYALGLIILECLTGRRAVTGESVGDICVKQVTEPVGIPEAIRTNPFGAVIARACSKDPEERYKDALEMLHALEAIDVSGTVRVNTGKVSTDPSLGGSQTGNLHQDVVSDPSPPMVALDEPPQKKGGHVALILGLVAILAVTIAVTITLVGGSKDTEANLQGEETDTDPGVAGNATSATDPETGTAGTNEQAEAAGDDGAANRSDAEGANPNAAGTETAGSTDSAAPTGDGTDGASTEPGAGDTTSGSDADNGTTDGADSVVRENGGRVIPTSLGEDPPVLIPSAEVSWTIKGRPGSAETFIGGERVCKRLPCEVKLPRPEANLSASVRASGYSSKRVVLPADGGAVTARLRKKKTGGSERDSGTSRIQEFE